MPRHAEIDADTINAGAGRGGKFAAEVLPAQRRAATPRAARSTGDARGDHALGFPGEAYAQFVEGGWPASSCERLTAARACRWWSTSACTR